MLNDQQQAAVRYINGPLLVLAGAGSGKTSVITQKIAYLITQCAYSPSSICAVTFTNKAANEMRTRIATLLSSSERRGLKVATFHTLGLSIIKREANLYGLKKGFSIFDSDDCLQLLKNFLPANKANDRDVLFSLQQQISRWKNDLLSPEQVLNSEIASQNPEASAIYSRYQHALLAYNALDFDDLIRIPVQLFRQHPIALEYWQNKIRHLLVDEYQDSNTSQYILVKQLTGVRAHFTVVGDDDQSIYAWRGARPENLSQLQQDYPTLKVIKLEQNYRSTHIILNAANRLIAHNSHIFEKKLWSNLGQGDLIRIIRCKDEQDEAEQVIADIISHKMRLRYSYGDYAILYRGNHQSRIFEKVLRHYGVSYHISGGQSWFAKTEVKDIFSYLKLLCNEQDDAAFIRAINNPKRGIGETSLDALGQYAQRRDLSLYTACDHLALKELLTEKPRIALQHFKSWFENLKQILNKNDVVESLKQMVEQSGYEAYIYEQSDNPAKAQKKMENVWELIEWVGRLLLKNNSLVLEDVINKLILIDILEQSDERDSSTVQLMTLHASKGLEFPFVYLVGMEEELLPHRVSIDEDQIEEERRLAYVGVTRAQKSLCFTLANQRRRVGEMQDCVPSRFLEELPSDYVEWHGKKVAPCEERSKNLAQSHLAGLKNLLNSEA